MPSYKTDLIRVPKSKQFNDIRVNIVIQELIKQLPVINRVKQTFKLHRVGFWVRVR